MYRTNAYKEEPSTPTTEKFQITTSQVIGSGLFLLTKSLIVLVIGMFIHMLMVPNDKIPHTDPLIARIFWYLGITELGLGCLILAALLMGFLWKVVIGKEQM